MIRQNLHVEAFTLHRGRLRFSARECGQGPLVLFLHGFPDNLDTWREQLPAVAAAGFRSVAVMLRGYEPGSQPVDGAYGAADLAGDVLAFLDQLGAAKAHLVGHDWGGAIAYAAAATAPERFTSIVTMTVPHPGRFLTELVRYPAQLRLSWYMLFFQLRGISERAIARNDHEFIRRLWRDWSPGWTPPVGQLEGVIETLRRPGVLEASLAYYRSALALGNIPFTRAARRAACYPVHVPTLALTGSDDGCIGSSFFHAALRKGDFPSGLEVVTVPGAGHFLHLEEPDAVNRLLLDWLCRYRRVA